MFKVMGGASVMFKVMREGGEGRQGVHAVWIGTEALVYSNHPR